MLKLIKRYMTAEDMKKTLILVFLGSLLRLADGFCGNPPMEGTGFWAKVFTKFTETDNLGKVPPNLCYVFIIARHGMVVPMDKSYPKDKHFKSKWKEGRFTTHGRRMMQKLGRSLATRYKPWIDKMDGGKVEVTTMDTLYGYNNAQEVLKGLYGDTAAKPKVFRRADIDKFQLFKSPEECPVYQDLRKEMDPTKKNLDTNFFEFLRKKTGEKTEINSDWYINSFDGVYRLWEILEFERKSKQWSPFWYNDETREKMKTKVEETFFAVACSNKLTTPLVIGPMLNEVINGYFNTLRIHITNDFTYAVFRAILTGNLMSVPEYGETLMVEVNDQLEVNVHSYKPYRTNDFKKNIEFIEHGVQSSSSTLQNIKNRLQQQRLLIDDQIWKRKCVGGIKLLRQTLSTPTTLRSQEAQPPAVESPHASTSTEQEMRGGKIPLQRRSSFPNREEIGRVMPREGASAVTFDVITGPEGSKDIVRSSLHLIPSHDDGYHSPRGDASFRQL